MSVTKTMLTILVVLWASPLLLAQQGPVYKPGEYPAPRYPNVKPNYTMQELVALAHDVVRWPYSDAFLQVGYNIKPGQKALIVVPGDFDQQVAQAIVLAIQEAGGSADMVRLYGPARANAKPGIETASREAQSIIGYSSATRERRGLTDARIMDLAELGEYNVLIYRAGGPPSRPLKIPMQYILWDRIDKFVTTIAFPMELQNAIDQATWDTLIQGRHFRATDPEGTNITWSAKPNQWEDSKTTYQESMASAGQKLEIVHGGHIGAIPLGMGVQDFMNNDAAGVVAGTLNHAGPFPHIRMTVSKGNAVSIEGGGEYGQLWRQGLDKWSNIQYPGVSGPGKNKLWEVAIGTNPKSIRPKSYAQVGGSWERSRSAVIHWGIGSRTDSVNRVLVPKEWSDFSHKHEGAEGHAHIHTYFTTMEVEMADGRKVLVMNKGRLTALDDPKVRQIAANDPVSYIRKEIEKNYKY